LCHQLLSFLHLPSLEVVNRTFLLCAIRTLSFCADTLDELRRARQLTQAKIAETLGVNQGEVSKIEHRTDLYLSTLSEYVEALGGALEIRAVFPDSEVRITQFESLP
jgi:DNA-binding XRE family transcriptional regulator